MRKKERAVAAWLAELPWHRPISFFWLIFSVGTARMGTRLARETPTAKVPYFTLSMDLKLQMKIIKTINVPARSAMGSAQSTPSVP